MDDRVISPQTKIGPSAEYSGFPDSRLKPKISSITWFRLDLLPGFISFIHMACVSVIDHVFAKRELK